MSEPMTPPPVPGQKKKMSALGWVAIGCGAIAIVAILAIGAMVAAGGWFFKKQANKFEENPAVAAAEWAIRANPDVELVESDVKAGTITFRDKKSGEVVTMNAEDIKDGKLSFETKDGTTTLDGSSVGEGGTLKVTNEKGEEAVFSAGTGAPKNLPSWLPVYGGAKVEGSYDATTAEGRNAMFTVTSSDSLDQVAEFYQSKLEEAGMKVERSSFETDGQKTVMLAGTTDGDKRMANIIIATNEGQTAARVTFGEKN
jgi:hypothetical protein